MTQFYQGLQATAADLLEEFGTQGTLTRKTVTTPDADEPHRVEEATQDHDIVLVAGEYELADIDGTVILSGDRRLYVAAEGLTVQPEPADEITYTNLLTNEDETLTVIDSNPVSPAGLPLLYDVQVRA